MGEVGVVVEGGLGLEGESCYMLHKNKGWLKDHDLLGLEEGGQHG